MSSATPRWRKLDPICPGVELSWCKTIKQGEGIGQMRKAVILASQFTNCWLPNHA
jgi:hypothetical protein